MHYRVLKLIIDEIEDDVYLYWCRRRPFDDHNIEMVALLLLLIIKIRRVVAASINISSSIIIIIIILSACVERDRVSLRCAVTSTQTV